MVGREAADEVRGRKRKTLGNREHGCAPIHSLDTLMRWRLA
jgi:hypothetical protein